jgi:alcohol dehydrogenase (cytochrome c)
VWPRDLDVAYARPGARAFQARATGLARLGRRQHARSDPEAGGKRLLSAAPKDGHLHGIDLTGTAKRTLLYRTRLTKIENVDAPFATDQAARFCPGASGGSEWNGPAYDPATNLIITGEVDWCTIVKRPDQRATPGCANRRSLVRQCDAHLFHRYNKGLGLCHRRRQRRLEWRRRPNYPIVGGVTPTAGSLMFVGDVGRSFYALDALSDEKMWARRSAVAS